MIDHFVEVLRFVDISVWIDELKGFSVLQSRDHQDSTIMLHNKMNDRNESHKSFSLARLMDVLDGQ